MGVISRFILYFYFATKYNNGRFRDLVVQVLRGPPTNKENWVFHSWSGKILHAMVQLNRAPNYWSQHPRAHAQHPEKPPLRSPRTVAAKPSATKNKSTENSWKKNTLNLGDIFKWHEVHHEKGKIFGQEESFVVNTPAWCGDNGIMAERSMPHQFSCNSQSLSYHPRTLKVLGEKPAGQEYIPEKLTFKMKESISHSPNKANLMEFITH